MNKNLLEVCNSLDALTVDVIKATSNMRIIPKLVAAIEKGNAPTRFYSYSWVEANNLAMKIQFDLSNDLTDDELDFLAEKIANVIHNLTMAFCATSGFMDFVGITKKIGEMSFKVH